MQSHWLTYLLNILSSYVLGSRLPAHEKIKIQFFVVIIAFHTAGALLAMPQRWFSVPNISPSPVMSSLDIYVVFVNRCPKLRAKKSPLNVWRPWSSRTFGLGGAVECLSTAGPRVLTVKEGLSSSHYLLNLAGLPAHCCHPRLSPSSGHPVLLSVPHTRSCHLCLAASLMWPCESLLYICMCMAGGGLSEQLRDLTSFDTLFI